MAQQITVKDLKLLPQDRTAIEQPVLDNSKEPCALVKIDAGGLKGLFFPKKGYDHINNSYDKETGYYLVYIPAGMNRLAYNHAEYLAGNIIFSDHISQLDAGKTYLLTLEATTSKRNSGIVIITVTPAYAHVVFDGKEAQPIDGGVYTFNVKPGTYDYSVEAENFVTQNGTANAEEGKETKISAELPWIRHNVHIKCNVKNAQVYVDDGLYGPPGEIRLPQGMHRICVKAKDYLDMEKFVTINAYTPSLNFHLKKNENIVRVGAVEVTIYSLSNSSRIYKNGRQVKEWKKNGDVVKFMPGKYLLSDDYYNEYKLVIKKRSDPIKVKF